MPGDLERGDSLNDGKSASKISSQLMKDPNLLAALQNRLGNVVGASSGYIESLPNVVKRRIRALKNIQLEHTNIEAEFYKEISQLEAKYHSRFHPLYLKRTNIVDGSYEPTDTECVSAQYSASDEIAQQLQDKVLVSDPAATNQQQETAEVAHGMDESTRGVPHFWLTVLQNFDLTTEMIQEHDVPVLKHLTDIRLSLSADSPLTFTLEFHFSNNVYFTNDILTKTYHMKCTPDPEDPFSFDGPEIHKCEGCSIDWNQGKNVTVKVVKRRQKHRQHNTVRVVQKTVQNDSFFNFFSPPQVPDDNDTDIDETTHDLITSDFEIGHCLRERVIPRAVLFFTGEELDQGSDEEEEYESDEDGDDQEEEEGSECQDAMV